MMRAKANVSLPCASALALVVLALAIPAGAQTAPLKLVTVPIKVDSGIVQNTGTAPEVVFSQEVTVPDATWLRLNFDVAKLSGEVGSGNESYLLITSQFDGAFQYLNALHVKQWRNTSAYFNGDTVLIELIACPGTGPNQLVMSQVVTGEPTAGERSICGPTDDRELSYDPRAGRLQPGGCTGWIINDCAHCLLTAGHCSSGNDVVEFNVPLSDPNGSLNHPGPEDQYHFEPASVQSNGGQGIGDDWAYFGCYPNSNTGKTPYEAQGDCYVLAMPPQVSGQDIRITGYGVVYSPVSPTWNQVQKTHVGPYAYFGGTEVGYQTDTTGGNSGSPVILEQTGEAIGIHTHGGCSSGYNHGTGANHAGLQAALANPKGVCIPPPGLVVTPSGPFESQGDPGGPFTPESMEYTLENMSDAGFDYEVTKTEDWVTLDNATGHIAPAGSAIVTVHINANANSLPVGEYTDTLEFVNLTTHEGDTTRDVILTVGGPKRFEFFDMDTDPGWATEAQWAWGQPTGQGGAYGNPDPTSGYTGDNVYGYNLNGDYTNNMPEYDLTTTAIDCSEATGVKLRFRRWLGVERNQYDHAYIRVSNDGTTWNQVWENPDQETADSEWTVQEYDISDYADNEPTVYVRWTMGTTDSGWTYCGWNIDDVEFWGLVPYGLVGDINCDGEVNFGDINPFVLAMTDLPGYLQQYPNCPFENRDINGDGKFDFGDINPFVALLAGN